MLSEIVYNRYLEDILKMRMANAFDSMEKDTELFETLLCSYENRLRAVNNVHSRHTDT